MSLSSKQITDIEARLRRLGAVGLCPACGQKVWQVQALIGTPVAHRVGVGLSSEMVPSVAVSCRSCGYSRLFAANLMGLE